MQQYTWFFSLKDSLSPAAKAQLQASIDAFLAQWKTHGVPVDGLVRIAHDRFVIVQSNPSEGRPSGCSIDSLKRGMTQVLQQNEVETVDAAHVYYRQGDQIQYTHFKEISQQIAQGILKEGDIVFDHSLGQSDDLTQWEKPLQDTWLKRYL